MRVVLFGVTRLSLECFHTLVGMGLEVAAVVTTPREFRISYASSPVVAVQYADLAVAAEKAGVPVIVVTGRMADYADVIEQFAPDFLLLAGWYYLIPSTIRRIAPRGCAGVHASRLPKYRGGAPINWALINGEEQTGITLFYLDDGVDTGDIIASTAIPIAFEDTCGTLYEKVIVETQVLLKRYLPMIAKDSAPRVPQDERDATWFPQRFPEDGRISWSCSTLQMYNWVRALTRPYPGAFTFFEGRRIVVWKAALLDEKIEAPPGTVLSVVTGRSLDVATVDGSLRVSELGHDAWERVTVGKRFTEHA
jgi:methionyl-tRNA formyltransferase